MSNAAPTAGAAPTPRVLFVTGIGRSGTTAMADLLNAHPSVCIGIERYKFKFLRRGDFEGHEFTPERFFDFREDDTNILPSLPGRWRRIYARLEDKLPRSTVVGDKIPNLFEKFSECRTVFPQARWIYMLRDIEGVAASWTARALNPNDRWPEKNDFRAAVRVWNRANAMVLKMPADTMMIVDYDAFFSGNRAARRAVLDFIGIEDSPDFVEAIKPFYRKYSQLRDRDPVTIDGQAEHLAETANLVAYRRLRARAIGTRLSHRKAAATA